MAGVALFQDFGGGTGENPGQGQVTERSGPQHLPGRFQVTLVVDLPEDFANLSLLLGQEILQPPGHLPPDRAVIGGVFPL